MTVDRRIIDLYNEYVHTALPRREFLDAPRADRGRRRRRDHACCALLEPNYAQARQVEPDDKRLKTEQIEFNGPNGPIKAYTARPAQDASRRQASRRAGDPREPRPQRAHRRRGAARARSAATWPSRPMDCRWPVARPPTRKPRATCSPRPTARASPATCSQGVPWLAADPPTMARSAWWASATAADSRCARRWKRARRRCRGGLLRQAARRPRRRKQTQGAGAAALRRRPTSASTPASRISARRSMRRACRTASTCTRARSTASTTIRPRRATTRRPRSWRGSARMDFFATYLKTA